MLVISRKVGERICIGDDICVTVVRIAGGTVRLGIDAPADVAVVRYEHATPSDMPTLQAWQHAPRASNSPRLTGRDGD